MVYATLSTGFRPGGLNRRGTLPPYRRRLPEELRGRLEDHLARQHPPVERRALLRELGHFQFSFLGANGLTEIRNAGKAKMKGLETDINWPSPTASRSWSGGLHRRRTGRGLHPRPSAPPEATEGTRRCR
jgi:hypothetical protein